MTGNLAGAKYSAAHDDKKDFFHSSGYAQVQNGAGIGATGASLTLKQRQALEKKRQFVQKYADSQLGRSRMLRPTESEKRRRKRKHDQEVERLRRLRGGRTTSRSGVETHEPEARKVGTGKQKISPGIAKATQSSMNRAASAPRPRPGRGI